MNKKICIVHNSLRTVLIFRKHYIEKLLSDGFQVFCVAPNDDEKAKKILMQLGVEILDVRSSSPYVLFFTMNYRLFSILIRNRLRVTFVCHFLSTITITIPSLFVCRSSICFVEGMGTFFTKRKNLTSILKYLLWIISSKIVFMNEEEKNILGRKTDYVLNGIGVDLNRYKPFPDTCVIGTSMEGRNSLNLLYVGRLVEDKGVYDCISVLRKLLLTNPGCVLNLVGDIYQANPGAITNEDINRYEEEFGDSIVFHRYKDDVLDHYLKSDVLLLLSKHEGFPVVAMEANACGVPVLAYDVPGCRQAIQHGLNGYLIELGGIDQVVQLLNDTSFSAMSVSCRNYAVENFDRDVKTRDIVSILTTSNERN